MKPSRIAIVTTALSLLSPLVSASSLELAGWVGPTFPFYDQTFRYDPGLVTVPIPGVTVRQEGSFAFHGRGGLALGGGVTWYIVPVLGIEGRLDTADVKIQPEGGVFNVSADLPAPLPDLSTQVSVGSGVVNVRRATPFSANLKLRTPGPVAFMVSGGLSYLPALELVLTQRVGLGVTGLGLGTNEVTVATLGLRAETRPEGPEEGHLGLNAGAGLQFSIGGKLRLFADGRFFYFKEQTLVWSRADTGTLSPLEEALLREVESRLEPVEFRPTFFQATAGLAITF
jgi:hypothetical protein